MKRLTGLAAVCVLALASAAPAERATMSFDALEAGVTGLQNALPGTRDRDEKKASKVYVSVIVKLSKDTRSLKAELKRGRQILPKLGKLGIPEVDALVTGSVSALADEIYERVDEAQRILDGTPAKVSRAKVQTLLDAARNHIERGVAAVKVKKRLVFLLRAESRSRRALALAAKVPPPDTGGNGDSCPGRSFVAGETATVSSGGGPARAFDALGFKTVQVGDTATTTIGFYDCSSEPIRVVNVVLPAPTPVGSYDQAAAAPAGAVRFSIGDVGTVLAESTSGTAELTSVVGRLTMTFSFIADGVTHTGSVDVEPRP